MSDLVKIGPLSALCAGPESADYTYICLHGYGASAGDLFPLHQVVASSKIRWIFPDAPLEVPIAPGYIGKAWFPIDVNALEKAMAAGSFREFLLPELNGFGESFEKLQNFIEAVGTTPDKLILGGFSQGAMLATHLCLNHSERIRALSIWSTGFIHQANWQGLIKNKSGMNFFQSHGRGDPLLSFDEAQQLSEIFLNSSWQGKFHDFSGGHEIPPSVLEEWKSFIETQVS